MKRTHEPSEVVADKGYHSKMVMLALQLGGWRSYIAEPRRGRQHWEGETEERDAVYANRRRKNGRRGRHLMRRRGEIIERTFAHVLETGGMRRLYLCHQENLAKRLLVHIAGYNLGLLMRKCFGVGKPRCLQGQSAALWAAWITLWDLLASLMRLPGTADRENLQATGKSHGRLSPGTPTEVKYVHQ